MTDDGGSPRLVVFSDTTRAEPEQMLACFAELGRRARAGTVLFTLRDYELSTRELWELGIAISSLAARTEQRFGVAERADLARALSASAFHLPERGLEPADARRFLGSRVWLSQACHDAARVADHELDARLVSPIFAPRKGRPALGLSVFGAANALEAGALEAGARGGGEAARSGIAWPKYAALFALGGVDASNAAACLAAGAAGVAVIGAALALDPSPLLAALGIARR